MHGRPRDYKHKLRDPKAQESYKKKARHRASEAAPQKLHTCTAPQEITTRSSTTHLPSVRGLRGLWGRAPQVDAIRNGTALILQCRQLKRYDETVLTASAKLLKVVPEVCGQRRDRLQTPVLHISFTPPGLFAHQGPGRSGPAPAPPAAVPAPHVRPPQIYTIWNFRREALGGVLAAGGDAAKAASDGELALTQACVLGVGRANSASRRKDRHGWGALLA